MGKRIDSLTEQLISFIEDQKVYFVATAMSNGAVNLSPKGMDSFRILAPNRAMWLNVTGSGNETAAHLLENDRITIMFCAFEGKPLILRYMELQRCIINMTRNGMSTFIFSLRFLVAGKLLIFK